MNKEQVVKLMESSETVKEWNDNCDEVKKSCGGYPDFWYSEIVLSGLASRRNAYFEYGVKIKG